jgi:hypothetical protein
LQGRRGARYILIFFSEDKNYIHIEHKESRSAKNNAKTIRAALVFFQEFAWAMKLLSSSSRLYALDQLRSSSPLPRSTNATEQNEPFILLRIISSRLCLAWIHPDTPKDLWSDYDDQIEEN